MKGHVCERPEGSGNWYAVYRVRDVVTGKSKLKWERLKGKITGVKQARTACSDLLASRRNGTYREPSKITLADFLDQWLLNIKPNVSARTHERYGEIARRNIVPLLGAVLVSDLTPAQISGAYPKALSEGRRDGKGGLSPQSVQHIHRVLKQALGPVRWERIHRNSEDHIVRPPKVEKREMKVYDVPQTVNLIDIVRGKRVFIPVVLAAMCGLRRGEIAGLRWGDVDLDRATLSVIQSAEQTRAGIRYKEPKRGRRRNVSLSASVVQELRMWRVQQAQEMLRLGIRANGETLICTTAAGEGIQPNSLTHEWLKAIDGTALPRIRFHDLRHSHATHMLGSGVHVKVASERLGHSKIAITLDLYSHVLPGMQEDAVAKIDAAFEAHRKA